MLQFPLPQFIDVEDTIIGPFTMKQFGFMFGGGLLLVAIFRIFGSGIIFWILAVPVALLTAGIAFGKFNGRRVYDTFPIIINFLTGERLYVFNKNSEGRPEPLQREKIKIEAAPKVQAEPVQSRLKQISALLDRKNVEEFETLKIKKDEQRSSSKTK